MTDDFGARLAATAAQISGAVAAAEEQMIVAFGLGRVAELRRDGLGCDFVDKNGCVIGRVELVFEGMTVRVLSTVHASKPLT